MQDGWLWCKNDENFRAIVSCDCHCNKRQKNKCVEYRLAIGDPIIPKVKKKRKIKVEDTVDTFTQVEKVVQKKEKKTKKVLDKPKKGVVQSKDKKKKRGRPVGSKNKV